MWNVLLYHAKIIRFGIILYICPKHFIMGKLYLLPNLLGETPIGRVIPDDVIHIIKNIKVFATENVKNTRRYLKKIDKAINIDELVFLDLNEHSDIKDIETYLPYLADQDMGIISEAGCPGIADPGAELVALAHKHDYQVIPLVGPSSILLALIASGLTGKTSRSMVIYLFLNRNVLKR